MSRKKIKNKQILHLNSINKAFKIYWKMSYRNNILKRNCGISVMKKAENSLYLDHKPLRRLVNDAGFGEEVWAAEGAANKREKAELPSTSASIKS